MINKLKERGDMMDKTKLKRNTYSFILGLTIGNAALIGYRKYESENKLGMEFAIVNWNILLDNDEKIDKYLGRKVSFSDVKNTVTNNTNLDKNDKKRILRIVNNLEKKVPYIDLRCFNLNCKNLRIVRQEIKEKGVSGLYNIHDNKITLGNGSMSVFNHEILHLLNNMDLEIDGKRIIKNYNCNMDDLYYQVEAFTEWLNSYVFEYPVSSYQTEVSNLNIMKKILNISDADLINIFINKNYNDFSYLIYDKNKKFTQVNEILEKNKKDMTNLNDWQIKKITDIYLDTYIKINGSQVSDRLYQFIDCLCKNYVLNCNNTYDEQIKFRNNVVKRIAEKLEVQNPIIYGYLGDKEEYVDIDNLYLVCSKKENDNNSYFLAEKYKDEDNNEILTTNLQKIYLNLRAYDCNHEKTDYRISINQVGEEEQFYISDYIPVKYLLCGNIETNINELITNYENDKQQSKVKRHSR